MQVKEAMIHRDEMITASTTITVEEAMKVLSVNRIGSLVLTNENDEVEGIVTARDLMNAVASNGPEGLSKLLQDIMSVKLLLVNENDSLNIAIGKMEEYFTHHILVKGNSGKISGLLSSYDIVRECAIESLAF